MSRREIVIIGAGMGGLAAGIYGQASGYRTRIFEAHSKPGGQAATWQRRGFSFDGCIHHLFGCQPGTPLYRLWQELGAMPRDLIGTRECTAVMGADGSQVIDYYDLDRLREELLRLSPADGAFIDDYLHAIRLAAGNDFMGEILAGSKLRLGRMVPAMVGLRRWFKPTMADLGQRFSDPFLRQAVPLMEYSLPEGPAFLHVVKHAYGLTGGLQWPVGGAAAMARSMADRYRSLGGELYLSSPVQEIITAGDYARGARLESGEEIRADMVISNADGRRTITHMLHGRFMDDTLRAWIEPPADEDSPWAVHVFLGVDRDLAEEPSALVMLLDEPVEIAGHQCRSIEMQTYGMDPTMAPPGKGVIKVELFSRWSYWQALLDEGRAAYDAEKRRVTAQVVEILERRWPGLGQQIEVSDVPTLQTWKRYMHGFQGFQNMPARPFDVMAGLTGRISATIPGLHDFYFVGAWATSAGALFVNALSGRTVLQRACKEDGRRFTAPLPRG